MNNNDAIIGTACSARGLPPMDFRIRRGSITGLLGPSGAGKTTLMRMIVGTQADVTGTVEVLGLPAGSPQLRSKVGYATQQASVYPDLSVTENVAYCADLLKAPRAAVDAVIARVGLVDKRKTLVDNLSGGQRSRVSLAMALVGKPELLVLDEPTVGLDPLLRVSLWELFRELAAEGTTLLVSSHVLDEAEHCDELLLIRDGHLHHTTAAALKQETGTASMEEAFIKAMTTQGALQ